MNSDRGLELFGFGIIGLIALCIGAGVLLAILELQNDKRKRSDLKQEIISEVLNGEPSGRWVWVPDGGAGRD